MKRKISTVLLALLFVFAATSCDQKASRADIAEPEFSGDVLPRDYAAKVPDVLVVFQNVDQHPTIVKLCLDGVAFRTISTAHSQGGLNQAVERVPEWDEDCQ